MTTEQTAVQRYRRPRGQFPKRRDSERRPKPPPEHLEAHEVDALILAAALLFLVQWRAGLRVSEALVLEVRDLSLDSGLPAIHVRRGAVRERSRGSSPSIPSFTPRSPARYSSGTSHRVTV